MALICQCIDSCTGRSDSSRSARFPGRVRAHDRPAVPRAQPRRALLPRGACAIRPRRKETREGPRGQLRSLRGQGRCARWASRPRSLSVTRREACRPLHGRAIHARHRQSARSRACFGQARSAPKESCPTGLGQPTLPRVCAQQISAGRRRRLHEDLLWAGVRCVHRRPVYSRRILGQRPAGRSRPRTGCR